tara:strand:- start:19 stop:234 length:216 start_codon:yes stop_codon:yes gene_type:complete
MSKNTCIVNGNEFQIEKTEFHLEDLVKKILKDKKIRVAIAVNSRLVMKSDWKKKKILNGDKIEIVQPYFGG